MGLTIDPRLRGTMTARRRLNIEAPLKMLTKKHKFAYPAKCPEISKSYHNARFAW
jgi:hypothetical protein